MCFQRQVGLWAAAAGLLAVSGMGYAEEVVLRGGSTVSAPVLKEDDEAVVLDLGFDVLRVPQNAVVEILDTAAATNLVPEASRGPYQVAHSAPLSTVEAAARYAPAVVVVKTARGLGSGFFVNPEGLLLTNFHVIQGERRITVTRLAGGDASKRAVHRDVEIVATAPFQDLAVLQVQDLDEEVVSVIFSPDDEVSVGETVFAIGNPLGLEWTVTEGVVSQPERNFRGILYRQIDAPVNPGNSGGPLFNNRGQVVGVINMTIPTMEGLNFAIPTLHARYVLDHLDAFAFDVSNPETGYVYPAPPPRPGRGPGTQPGPEETSR